MGDEAGENDNADDEAIGWEGAPCDADWPQRRRICLDRDMGRRRSDFGSLGAFSRPQAWRVREGQAEL